MRVLILRRQNFGSTKVLTEGLAAALDTDGIEVVVDDADWIPDKTGFGTDKEVSKKVKRAAQGFDLVHAWGYRAAWACSEAFYLRFPWIYTAYDMPKTTHSDFIDRLNATHRGVCSSPSVRQALDDADALNLETVFPGVVLPADPNEAVMDRDIARKQLGARDDVFLIVTIGRFSPEKGIDAVVEAMHDLRHQHPDVKLYVSGSGPVPPPIHQQGVEVTGPLPSVWPALCGADLVVVPSKNAGFSLLAAEAMWSGVPVMMRSTAGLADMAEEGLSGFYFAADEELAPRMSEVIDMELTRETVARGGQLRSQARFKFERFAREMAGIYREVAGA